MIKKIIKFLIKVVVFIAEATTIGCVEDTSSSTNSYVFSSTTNFPNSSIAFDSTWISRDRSIKYSKRFSINGEIILDYYLLNDTLFKKIRNYENGVIIDSCINISVVHAPR
jgi:hypothetical protein